MSVGRFLQQGAAGNAGAGVYVDDVFSTYLYEGNGSTQTITNGIDLAGEGGLVWTKDRERTQSHALFDTERGANQVLISNSTAQSQNIANSLTSFNSDGFSLGGAYNASGYDIASWTFRKQPGFFDVVTYTGTGSVRTVSHNLGSVPGMIIIKRTSSSGSNWRVYHTSLGNGQALSLNTTDAAGATTSLWNSTTPTDSVFTLGDNGNVNQSGQDFVAYLFAHDAQDFGTDSDESIIKCGSYTGNGSSDGPEIDLGFEPQWLMLKGTDSTSDWLVYDVMRGIVTDGNDQILKPNSSDSEVSTDYLSLKSTGFKLNTTSSFVNFNGYEYIYVAIRRPHKPASEFAATDLFAMDSPGNTSGGSPKFVSGFPVDMAFFRNPSASNVTAVESRLTGGNYLQTNSTSSEAADALGTFDYQNGHYDYFSSSGYQSWMFRRAPGFFDVVCYTGSSAAQEISHNLGVAPELILQKCRTQGTYPWNSWHKDFTNNQYINLNTTNGVATSSNLWGTNATVATDSVFRTGSGNTGVDGSTTDTHIAYLFATAPGISKVGSYTGTAANLDVDCGFTSGARFVLVKRTDSTGAWHVWDSVRGIVAGNDPYLLLSSTVAQATSTDYIDPLSSGFTITSSAPAVLNASGGTYIFLAIA